MKLLVPLANDELLKGLSCIFCNKNNLSFAIIEKVESNYVNIKTHENLITIAYGEEYQIGKWLFRMKAMDL